MCPNEECLYPFDQKDMFKSSVFEDRSLNSDGTPRKRHRTAPLGEATNMTKSLTTETSVPSSSSPMPSKVKARKDKFPLPKPKRSKESAVADKSEPLPTLAPPSTPTSTPTASGSPAASTESLLELLFSDTPAASKENFSDIQAISEANSPLSSDDLLPDLTFDFMPSVSWTTPVTPPNQRSSPLKKGADISTSNLENLLFDDQFEVDFGNLEGFNHLEFDADLEAILQQHL
ncbi:hypothetical protein EMPS_05098 [Entomortierella parvispora]|uniref:Uncharacterized protein n=1 Tax=Entomortierella parvispora TaxID=205924 RepID=A0A9P3HA29_9FUNG|nr:hypothetical protein EMPS_05098 [Entomortierella parvispora]